MGSKVEGVGVMKDEELKLEDIEASHTLGGAGEVSRGEGRGECTLYHVAFNAVCANFLAVHVHW